LSIATTGIAASSVVGNSGASTGGVERDIVIHADATGTVFVAI
jgi:hypothetical protein